ncbi:Thiamine-monophosphate kinase [compost metagenome]
MALLVDAERVPLTAALREAAGERALQLALSGGDDYVLVFTLPPAALPGLQASGQPFHVIGRVEAGNGVRVLDRDGRDITPAAAGYQHFGGPDGQA